MTAYIRDRRPQAKAPNTATHQAEANPVRRRSRGCRLEERRPPDQQEAAFAANIFLIDDPAHPSIE